MKKPCLFLLLCFLSAHAYAQQAPVFGFSVNAGTFAFPSRKSEPGLDYSIDYSYDITRINAGESYAMGIWISQHIGAYLQISSELQLRSIRYSREYRRKYAVPNLSNFPPYDYSNKFFSAEYGLALPVRLHYKFKKDKKWSCSAGTGISYLIANDLKFKTFSQFNGSPPKTNTYTTQSRGWQNPNIAVQFNLGLHYQVSPDNSLCLEFTHEHSKKASQTQQIPRDPNGLELTSKDFRPNMNSFSVSLRHNILD